MAVLKKAFLGSLTPGDARREKNAFSDFNCNDINSTLHPCCTEKKRRHRRRRRRRHGRKNVVLGRKLKCRRAMSIILFLPVVRAKMVDVDVDVDKFTRRTLKINI